MKVLSKNQYLVLENWKIGERKTSEYAKKLLNLSTRGSGGLMSALYRNKYLKPIWKEDRRILWERIK